MASILIYLLDTALIATSFFNTITMLWLGLTVLLNAERRGWGTWAAGGGLLFGAAFFAVHSSVVGQAIWQVRSEMAVWWRVGWAPFVTAPYLWFLVVAWYSGALWSGWQRARAAVIGVVGVAALLLLLVANPVPSYGEIVGRAPVAVFTVFGVPAVVLIYPVYSTLCILLALLALRRPPVSQRFMGELGQARARPWLVAASFGLLVVSMVAGIGIGWLLNRVRIGEAPLLSTRSLAAIIGFDLILSGLIAVVIMLIGQAVVAYEIFTGKALPRGGLARYWRGTLLLAAGFGLLVGLSADLPIAPIYPIVLLTLLVTLLYALFSWQAFVERERNVARLRPFVASQRLYEQWLEPNAASAVDLATPFRALCADVLNTRVAMLAPLGALAALGGAPLRFAAEGNLPTMPNINRLTNRLTQPAQLCLSINQHEYSGALWAIPLWSERGLSGVLLLGEKRSGGLYTQEEIEIARAAGERLIDTQASAEVARRLVALQRQRLAESQILDRRTRRVLHDDVLPRIHAAMLALHAAQPAEEATALLTDVHQQIAGLLRELPPTAEPELQKLGLIGALRHTVESELRGVFDTVCWQIAPESEQAAATLSPLTSEVVFYAAREIVRNAARHGRGGNRERQLQLSITMAIDSSPTTRQICLSIADDGVGMQPEPEETPRYNAIQLIIGGAHVVQRAAPGAGQGLTLHSTMLAVIGGTLSAKQRTGGGAQFVIGLPCGGG